MTTRREFLAVAGVVPVLKPTPPKETVVLREQYISPYDIFSFIFPNKSEMKVIGLYKTSYKTHASLMESSYNRFIKMYKDDKDILIFDLHLNGSSIYGTVITEDEKGVGIKVSDNYELSDCQAVHIYDVVRKHDRTITARKVNIIANPVHGITKFYRRSQLIRNYENKSMMLLGSHEYVN